MSEETLDLLRKAKAQTFACRFCGLQTIHNYLMFLRDKNVAALRDASQLVLIDIRGETAEEEHNQMRVFKSQWFDLAKFASKVPTA